MTIQELQQLPYKELMNIYHKALFFPEDFNVDTEEMIHSEVERRLRFADDNGVREV